MDSVNNPAYRYLRGYCLDPGFSTRLDTAAINEVKYRIPFEAIEPGPTGEYVEVMDFDPASDCWYEPIDLRSEHVASQHGLPPSEGNPQFHQQLVYAVAMKTIRHFEVALGRKIIWYPRLVRDANGKITKPDRQYVRRLRIYPHALRDANAYYDQEKGALLFGYFSAAQQYQGANYPGGLVFTCLSPDIVAHETTHAILDALHHRYTEDTNPDVAAFHEGFADIIALLQRFTFADLVEHQLYSSGGRLDRYSVLGELATQFGEALGGNRGALRGMIGRWDENDRWMPLQPDPAQYADSVEAHDRGAVLVATIFDAFQRIYSFRTQDLLRIASNGTGVLPEGNISRDLVKRLASEACQIAVHLLHICIRALDYCPPHDITFGDYLRALITADIAIAPEDESGYRLALIEAFRARGIFPDRVNTLSPDSLIWNPPHFSDKQQQSFDFIAERLKPFVRELIETENREELFSRSNRAQAKMHSLLTSKENHFSRENEWEDFLGMLGLTSLPVSQLFDPEHQIKFLLNGKPNTNYVPPIEVHTFRPAFRAGREGRQIEQVIISLTQKFTADLGDDLGPKKIVFRGGCSIVLRLGDLSTVEYVVQKNIRSYRRFERQVRHQKGESNRGAVNSSMYADDDRAPLINFSLLHAD